MTRVLTLGLAALSLTLAAAADAKPAPKRLDPAVADDAFRMSTKQFCSLKEGEWAVHYWEGTVYSRIRGEKDRHLFNVAAMSMRQCKPFDDPVRGPGSRSVNREMVFYLDPQTNAVLSSWKNPWTGEEVKITHVQNDPVNAREPSYARDKEGKPTAKFNGLIVGDYVYNGGGAALLFYDNPMGGDYQDYVGGKYQASEFLMSIVPFADLADPATTRAKDSVFSWGRISRWMPWMKMGGREGTLIHYMGGLRINSFEELPQWMQTEIRTNYPTYMTPPPTDDTRPNDTSWTVMKRVIDAERAKAKADAAAAKP
jgi:hypothetical protein